MIQTLLTVFLIMLATLFLPVGVQLALYIIAIVTIRHGAALLIPAIFADVLYAPGNALSVRHLYMTMIVSVLLLIHWLVMTKTRIPQLLYGVEKK